MKRIGGSKEVAVLKAGSAEWEVIFLVSPRLDEKYGIKDSKVEREQKQLQQAVPVSKKQSKMCHCNDNLALRPVVAKILKGKR
ncbi:hypothetical protein [Zunongwangia sp. HRR-M8]|uniref:hypothetical protein n=1 Tax=Zunongwangia sp. HRR-M8 TaxID=3015170 RepID=UPI0022DDA04B|nr:hypothetical protein [Zunongwangia sp. HRR-M8]WBL22333.1 hypothetical protein PBT89_16660 [Zunongwangia sp. HRR-M8]